MKKIKNKDFLKALICFIGYFILVDIISIIIDLTVNIFIPIKEIKNIPYQIYSSIKYMIFPIIIFILFKNELIDNIKKFKSKISSYLPNIITPYILGLAVMMISNFILIFVLSSGVSTNEQQINELYDKYPIYVFIASCIFGPFIEEMIFRFSLRKLVTNDKIFIVASGLIFGLLHVIFSFNSMIDLLYVIPYGALGVSFAYTYVKTDNIWSTIFVHTLHNTALTILKMMV